MSHTASLLLNQSLIKQCSSCQCEECCKNSGAFIARLYEVPISSVESTAQTTLSRYHTTAGNQRGFCVSCRSWLFHCSEKSDVILTVDPFDKDAIKHWGRQLSCSEFHLWSEDPVKSLTDHLPGQNWKHHSQGKNTERIK